MNESVELASNLKSKVTCAASFPKRRFTWLSNEEIASILVAHDKHTEWSTHVRVQRPENGLILLFNRKEVKYRQDKYTWKTKRKSKFLREDRMKLKIGGVPYITATYVHSDILPTFHRRSYWLIQNPDIVLVHYLNYPYLEDGNHVVRDFSLNRHCDQWRGATREDVFAQLLPMFSQMPWPRQNSSSLTQKGKEMIVQHLVDQHFNERPSKLTYHTNKNGYIQPKSAVSNTPRKLLPYELIDGAMITTRRHQPSITLLTDQVCVANIQPLEVLSVPLITQQPTTVDNATTTTTTQLLLNKAQNIIVSTTPAGTKLQTTIHNNGGVMNTDQLITSPLLYSHNNVGGLPDFINGVDTTVAYDNVVPTSHTIINTDILIQSADASGKRAPKSLDKLESGSVIALLCKDHHHHHEGGHDQCVGDGTGLLLEDSKSKLIDDCIPFSPEDLLCEDISTTTDLNSSLLNGDTIFNQVLPSSNNSHGDDPWDSLDADLESCLHDNSAFEDVEYSCEMIDISDYSPDWAYTEGGIKILLIGNWTRTGNYKCVFDQISVEAVKLQTGVLRCYCPGHPAGHVDLHVTYNGYIVSRKVKFEYKPLPASYQDMSSQWLQLKDNEFKLSILERLESVENRLNSFGSSSSGNSGGVGGNTNRSDTNVAAGGGGGRNDNSGEPSDRFNTAAINPPLPPSLKKSVYKNNNSSSRKKENYPNDTVLQHRIGRLCHRINKFVSENEHLNLDVLDELSGPNQLSLIHIASGLGFTKIIQLMQRLWFEGENSFLQRQCHPNSIDAFRQTPLMWASGSGHMDCAEMLWQWNDGQVNCTDVIGRTAAGIATANGHWHISDRLMSLPERAGVLGDDGVSFETSSQDSGEFSMSTDNDVSLTDYEGNAQLETVDDVKCNNDISMNDFLMDDVIDENDSIAELAEQVIKAAEAKMHFSNSEDHSFVSEFDFRGDLPGPSNRTDWSSFVALPAPDPHDVVRFFDLRASCLTDNEKTHLHAAAQTFLQRQQSMVCPDEENRASLVIKYCYSKYKEFNTVKKMNEAAVLIQSKFRSYQEQKRFQRSRHAAILIQSSYRNYKSTRKYLNNLRSGLAKKQQHQAARKIQRFLRRCRHRA